MTKVIELGNNETLAIVFSDHGLYTNLVEEEVS